MQSGAGLRAVTTWGDEEGLHLSARARYITLNTPLMFLIHATCVHPRWFCSVSSALQNQNREVVRIWNISGIVAMRKEKSPSLLKLLLRPETSHAARISRADSTVARDAPPSWAGVAMPVGRDAAHQGCLKKDLKEVKA